METLGIVLVRVFVWVLATIVGTRVLLWGLGHDRWAWRGDCTELVARLGMALVVARCFGWV